MVALTMSDVRMPHEVYFNNNGCKISKIFFALPLALILGIRLNFSWSNDIFRELTIRICFSETIPDWSLILRQAIIVIGRIFIELFLRLQGSVP